MQTFYMQQHLNADGMTALANQFSGSQLISVNPYQAVAIK